VTVAFQGEPGAFSELAALRFFGTRTRTLSCTSFEEVFRAVAAGTATAGIVPVENSIFGSIHQNYDLLLRSKLHVIGELKLRIRLNLLGLPGSSFRSITTVLSQPQALGQCERFLRKLKGVHVEAVHDTAGAARIVRESGDLAVAAVASRRAGSLHGLSVLRSDVEDDPRNFTRFLVVSGKPVRTHRDSKTSIVCALRHVPGSLHALLGVLASAGVNLLALESRPMPGKPWEYLFYMDLSGSVAEPRVASALKAAQSLCIFLRVLGSYRRGRTYSR